MVIDHHALRGRATGPRVTVSNEVRTAQRTTCAQHIAMPKLRVVNRVAIAHRQGVPQRLHSAARPGSRSRRGMLGFEL